MYRISELADQVGLSRSALLYYEKLGVIQGQRQLNGYRIYGEPDLQRLRLLLQLQAAGLTLKECKACLEAKIERQVLRDRLERLDAEIAKKQRSRELLAALLGEGELRGWHEQIDRIAPDAHVEWLIKQGFNEKEALRLKWLSKDMNEHDSYMADFFRVYEPLDRWAPGSDACTLKALEKIPFPPRAIVDIGCGKGVATTVLAQYTDACITAVDNHPPALERLRERAEEAAVAERIETVCASMTSLPFDDASFDLVWSEGSAYIMGFVNALTQWRRLLKPGGMMVVSELVWFTAEPSDAMEAFWQQGYPDMASIEQRVQQAEAAGYEVVDSFPLDKEAWDAYTKPLQASVGALEGEMPESAALNDIKTELDIFRRGLAEFGYQVFILKLNSA